MFLDMLLEIDPAAIKHFLFTKSPRRLEGAPKGMTTRKFNKKRYFGMVVSDDALKPGKQLGECWHVRSMHQHFVKGREWRKTDYKEKYKILYEKLQVYKGGFEVFQSKKLERYDVIYEDIKLNGYKQASFIEDNIEVALSASGEILLIDGRHRLIIAQLLGLRKIPVVVNLISESIAKTFSDNIDHLRSQLHGESIDQHMKSLISVDRGKKNKAVLASKYQRNYFLD